MTDVLVYGSTPAGILAAVAASRHGASTALLSQRSHIGGMCSGGLGQTDIGTCPELVGGFAREFFERSAASYRAPQPRSPWNLEPHVAKRVFLNMLDEANVTMLPPSQVASVSMDGIVIRSIGTTSGSTYGARVFIDASYEGDLMARTHGVSYTWGREGRGQYHESGAGSQGVDVSPYGDVWGGVDPFDAQGQLLPLLQTGQPTSPGTADLKVQAYNFRLCVTDDAHLLVPFTRPPGYDTSRWEVLRRFWRAWPDSTSPHKAAQAQAPSAILGAIPSSSGSRKFDMNNCGYNPVHTDMIGGSADYPNASYARREAIWQAHVEYTQGFLWFMASDPSVPNATREAFARRWGYCGDEFEQTAHFPPQLYVREARRLVGDAVFTQGDVGARDVGNESIGMGCYNFDSHCVMRYACTSAACTSRPRTPFAAWECGVGVPTPGRYQLPVSLLLPKRREASNLLVPVCSSASHVAYATVRMEPQFMMAGHAAGIVAVLACRAATAAGADQTAVVQDVDLAALHAALLADGQILKDR